MANRKLPFGYRIRNGQIQIAEHEAEVVRMIFDRYAAGMSYGRLTDKLNGQDISYIPGKSWNINMVARVLQDERYLGGAYPQIVTPESFQRARAARPDVSGTANRTEIKDVRILARCGLCNGPIRRERKDRWQCPQCMDFPASIKDGHLIQCVERLLRRLREQPETAAPSPAVSTDDEVIQRAQDDFTHELDKPEFNESAATAKALALAAAKFNALGSDDYETMRLQYILENSKPQDRLDTALLRQITSAILIYPSGAVSLKLKNSQVIERSDSA